jgi:hypothetical protein
MEEKDLRQAAWRAIEAILVALRGDLYAILNLDFRVFHFYALCE